MYRGTNTEAVILDSIVAVKSSLDPTTGQSDPSKPDYPGYFAFDLFIQNSGIKEGETQGTAVESLQLNSTSSVTVKKSGGNSTTGLQNTPRLVKKSQIYITGQKQVVHLLVQIKDIWLNKMLLLLQQVMIKLCI